MTVVIILVQDQMIALIGLSAFLLTYLMRFKGGKIGPNTDL